MSKVITSPVKHFPGTVTLADPLTFPQVIAFQDALNSVGEMGTTTRAKINYTMLPAILKCIEKIDLAGFPKNVGADNWPASPRQSSAELIGWLIDEIVILHNEAETVPNA